MSEKVDWELVQTSNRSALNRFKVEGGYLYALNQKFEQSTSCMCFVPDVDLTRYQAHLRDAYKQGYQDGHEDGKQGVNNVSA